MADVVLNPSAPGSPLDDPSGEPLGAARAPTLLGIDLVEVGRVRTLLDGREALLRSIFTEGEIRYCGPKRARYAHYAARLAAKEAVFKALGIGFGGEVTWLDVETVHDGAGCPHLCLRGASARIAEARGVYAHTVSLTHAGRYAMAQVLLFCKAEQG